MSYRIGIDAGSKTIKLVVIDENGAIVHSVYEKHRAAIRETLVDVIHNLTWRYGDIVGPVAITGSAGMGIAQVLGLPFVQEVVATTKAVRTWLPDADAVIELGGEDAKVIYLTDGLEQRMNATCAGGTGGFIDNIAFMLGARSEQMNSLAMSATQLYPIASRCAVFAQTDVRPLLNSGAKRSDIAASALEAVVRQTLGGLCCGRPIRGKVVFLGGPLEHIPELVRRFRAALALSRENGVKPADAHLFAAKGAALAAGEDGALVFSLKVLERRIAHCPDPADDLGHLPPLFANEADRMEFDRRHAHQSMPRKSIYSYEGDAFLGIDAGSTTVKLALVTPSGELLYSDYKPVEGDCLKVASLMLGNMYRLLPKHYSSKEPYIRIAQSCVTGYGEGLLKAALKIDSGVVETVAHATAAKAFDPEVSFVLDIGGQDMKAMWLEEGEITDILLNEACSSGCGSFIEGTAYSLQTRPYPFGQAALEAGSPIDLGTKCTVFMTSRVRHAQKIGAPLGDIAAGIAYSVVKNALFRIIGRSRVASMGEHIVVQGGAFKSDAVLRAFELVAGVEVTRPDTAHLMGAIGAALTARDRACALPPSKRVQSATLGERALKELSCTRSSSVCPGCSNSCKLTVMDFGGGNLSIGGNRCSRASEFIPGAHGQKPKPAPNPVAALQGLMERYASESSADPVLGHLKVGIMDTLLQYEQLPFWRTLLAELGFSVEVPSRGSCAELRLKAAESIPSESACQAAKLSHERFYALVEAGVDSVLMPSFQRKGACTVSCGYVDALRDSARASLGSLPVILSPCLEGQRLCEIISSPADRDCILQALGSACSPEERAVLEERYPAALQAAAGEQRRFEERVCKATQAALDWVAADEARHGVVFAGRPYHMDPSLLHGVDNVAASVGLAVVPALGMGLGQLSPAPAGRPEWPHAARFEELLQTIRVNRQLELVCLESFGCGYDAVSLALVREELLEEGRLFTPLKLDDIVDQAHVRIRLRTLAESLESRRAGELRREERRRVEPPKEMPLPPGVRSGGETDADVMADGLSREDIELARDRMPADLCIVAAALASRCAGYCEKDSFAMELALPRVCESCLLDSVPALLRMASASELRISWQDPAKASPWQRYECDLELPPLADGSPLRVGLLGNALLCYEPLLNEGIVGMLEGLGCQVVMPRPSLITGDDVRFAEQLRRYEQQQVEMIIYLQSFGCLKGHVRVRGSMRGLSKAFPSMPITVIDYDPESSALNRENRIRLAVESAKEARPNAPKPAFSEEEKYAWLGDGEGCDLECLSQ